jgi:hypothetical protein
MLKLIECKGAPRDLGLDQGTVCRDAVREWIDEIGLRRSSRWLPTVRRLTSGGALGAGIGREVLRHYPHLGERMSGIARAAGVSLDSLAEVLARASYRSGFDPLVSAGLGAAAQSRSGAVLLGRSFRAGAPWILRRSRPEIGFASVEVSLPWLASGIAGVNEQGIAVAAALIDVRLRVRGLEGPPALLLVQECLQRFDSLDGALDWCLKRPAAGSLSLLLADSRGDAASVEFSGGERQLVLADSVVGGGPEIASAALRKQLANGASLGAELLDSALAGCGEDADPLQVWLDPAARTLVWRSAPFASGEAEPQVLSAED